MITTSFLLNPYITPLLIHLINAFLCLLNIFLELYESFSFLWNFNSLLLTWGLLKRWMTFFLLSQVLENWLLLANFHVPSTIYINFATRWNVYSTQHGVLIWHERQRIWFLYHLDQLLCLLMFLKFQLILFVLWFVMCCICKLDQFCLCNTFKFRLSPTELNNFEYTWILLRYDTPFLFLFLRTIILQRC